MENQGYEYFLKCKGIFILSVLMVHTPVTGSLQMNKIWNSLGTIGVVGFFITSGYLFYENNNSLKKLITKKYKRIVLPWFVCGSIVYLVSSFFGEEKAISKKGYFYFLFGYGSLYYFLTILVFLFLMFYFFKKREKLLYLTLCLTPCYIILVFYNFLPKHYQYLNILNWISFFSLGIILNKKMIINKIFNLKKTIFFLFIVFFMLAIMYNQNTYFTPLNFIFELLGVFSIFILIKILNKNIFISNKLKNIGEKSFTIYLLHMPLAGLLNILAKKNNFYFFEYLKFLIVLEGMIILINLYNYFLNFKFVKHNKKYLLKIIGLKVNN